MEPSYENNSGYASSAPRIDPWYRASTDAHPFDLHKKVQLLDPQGPPFCCIAPFPWTRRSMNTLWDGTVTDEELLSQWKQVIRDYGSAIVAGSKGRLLILRNLDGAKAVSVTLHDPTLEVQCAAWAISLHAPTDPLIIFTVSSNIFVLDLKRKSIVGELRGHGGPILSISVHPSHPYLFCTTSRDFTARIYDLSLTPMQMPENPHWPPSLHPSLAGPAHGLQMSESEGGGIGRCVAVLVGGRSGGHKGAVFCSAFHPVMPLIATCGMDRAVKIWRIPRQSPDVLAREDKPLFSTDLIHKARVLSIAWLSDDVLISHCAPALMRGPTENNLHHEEGTVVIWQWLSMDRFFRGDTLPLVMRGSASDYRQSESYKILSAYHLPLTTLHIHVHVSPFRTHDPLLLVPMGRLIRLFNLTKFRPREAPPFPLPRDDAEGNTAKRMRIQNRGDGDAEEDTNGEKRRGDDENEGPDLGLSQSVPLRALFEAVEGWDVGAENTDELIDVVKCQMAFDGQRIFGVGAHGTLYTWQLRQP